MQYTDSSKWTYEKRDKCNILSLQTEIQVIYYNSPNRDTSKYNLTLQTEIQAINYNTPNRDTSNIQILTTDLAILWLHQNNTNAHWSIDLRNGLLLFVFDFWSGSVEHFQEFWGFRSHTLVDVCLEMRTICTMTPTNYHCKHTSIFKEINFFIKHCVDS